MTFGDVSEAQLMVIEKVGAAFEAYSIPANGGDASKVTHPTTETLAAVSVAGIAFTNEPSPSVIN
jgi:hypothetical protein